MSASPRAPDHSVFRGSSLALLLVLELAACASPAPRLQAGEIGVIAGQQTTGLSDEAARRKVLSIAARLTVDHGYRYFVILPAAIPPGAKAAKVDSTTAIHAGQAQHFQIVRRATASRASAPVWDAYGLLTRRSPGN